ncbi:phBC6A51 family helix-turn-helix protein [Bacillus velezensis]|uniref:phBC6A51 family helix-turn-helix protein n=1 Tax=Bacillus velezensis TaxID=492670 RepID=UPI002DBA2216|nr:phBC6A51 family helix-turn-helix protein [Bacillus velezensis]MEC2215045.1 phBC6A51 family helix-turn-helix protein [Bacillus velezensis]
MSRMKELEAKLTLQQRKAAQIVASNEVTPEDGNKRSQDALAEEIGVSRMTLYRWRFQNPTFIEYMNLIADDMLSGHRSEVYGQIMKLIRGPQPSVKAIDLYLRRHGLLTDRQITSTETDGGTRSNEDIAKEIEELADIIGEEE